MERRVSDAERDAVVTQLREHVAAGRLTYDELPARVERAQTARTESELRSVLADVPDLAAWRHRLAHVRMRTHVAAFVLVNALLVLLWQVTREQDRSSTDAGAGYWWPFWIIGIWGVLLAVHAVRSRRPRRRALPPAA
jgi:DUF1707 SHOCT-like domain/2TM domain